MQTPNDRIRYTLYPQIQSTWGQNIRFAKLILGPGGVILLASLHVYIKPSMCHTSGYDWYKEIYFFFTVSAIMWRCRLVIMAGFYLRHTPPTSDLDSFFFIFVTLLAPSCLCMHVFAFVFGISGAKSRKYWVCWIALELHFLSLCYGHTPSNVLHSEFIDMLFLLQTTYLGGNKTSYQYWPLIWSFLRVFLFLAFGLKNLIRIFGFQSIC